MIWLIILLVVAVVVLLICLTFFLHYYNLSFECDSYPNYWCYKDWECFGETDEAKKFPAKEAYGCYDGVTRDEDFCNQPENYNTLGCRCKAGLNNDPDPTTGKLRCFCSWNQGENDDLGNCGIKYCSNRPDLSNCNLGTN